MRWRSEPRYFVCRDFSLFVQWVINFQSISRDINNIYELRKVKVILDVKDVFSLEIFSVRYAGWREKFHLIPQFPQSDTEN